MSFRNALIVFFVLLFPGCVQTELSFEDQLNTGSQSFQNIIGNPKYQVQIIYGEIIDDSIKHHYYQVQTDQFFYPASTVKMLAAFAAINKLKEDSLSIYSVISQDSSAVHPRNVKLDSLTNEPENIKNLLEQIFVFSDNRAYNILYSWLGKDYINLLYEKYGIETRVIHQLSETAFSFTDESNSNTANTRLYDTINGFDNNDQRVKEYTNQGQNFVSKLNPSNQMKGSGYINESGGLVLEPFDFSQKNYVPLQHLLAVLERMTRPDLFSGDEVLAVENLARKKLLDIMALRPSDIKHSSDSLPDNYVKFLMMGDKLEKTYSESIIIRNKVGWAYGYLTDVAYIEDAANEISFFLAATIHVNENEVYNDGIYEYETIGLPFLGELGRLVHELEIEKKEKLN